MKRSQPEQRFCNKCFTPLAQGAMFCPECGEPAPLRVVGICPNCGQSVMEGQAACYSCGALVSTTFAPVEPPKKKKPATGLWLGVLAVLLVAIIAVTVVLLFQPHNAEAVELAKSRVSMLPGDRVQLKYEVLPENTPDKSVTWKSSDESVATVKNGEVVAVESGTCTVTVTTSNGLTDSCTVSVGDFKVEAVELSETELKLHVGDTAALSCRVLPESAETDILWKCDNDAVISLDNGQVTAEALGEATITISSENGKKAQCKVTVTLREQEQLPLGDWSITGVENRFDETSQYAYGITLTVKADLTATLTQNGSTRNLKWCFSAVDPDGDYWYDLVGYEDGAQFLYSPTNHTLTVYLADENWVFAK
ncbi:MAG: Ig-like domain-containing protein [Clostridia bacterium]|nr:Ig-like domain-containing protein [Clostridia bacterium]